MTNFAQLPMEFPSQFNEMLMAVLEVDSLVVVALEWFEEQDWQDCDLSLIERIVFMLRSISRSAKIAVGKASTVDDTLYHAQPIPIEAPSFDGTLPTPTPALTPGVTAEPSNYRCATPDLTPDAELLVGALQDDIGRVDALLDATDQQFERFDARFRFEGTEAGDLLHHLAHLIGAARDASHQTVSTAIALAAELMGTAKKAARKAHAIGDTPCGEQPVPVARMRGPKK